jgi:predicted TIM-barrel fold metal-dependent hydrolase
MVAAMDEVGVDGALLVSPFSLYSYDASYALEVYKNFPKVFGLIKPFDPESSSIPDDVDAWVKRAGVVGARIMLNRVSFNADHPGLNQILSSASLAGIPVNMLCSGSLDIFADLAKKNPNTYMVMDHLGLEQPFVPPVPDEPFADLEKVISLSQYDNVAIKISGACTLSHQSYPYSDIWPSLVKIYEAFGLERCMWGTDWTRAIDLLTYKEGVDAFRTTDQLTDSERSQLMGGTLEKIYNWTPAKDI